MEPFDVSAASQKRLAQQLHAPIPGAQRAAKEERQAILAALRLAEELLEEDADAAQLVLDGNLSQILDVWYRNQGVARPEQRVLLKDLEERDLSFAWDVRYVLRASDCPSRLLHMQNLVQNL